MSKVIKPIQLWCWICPVCGNDNVMTLLWSGESKTTTEKCSNEHCYEPDIEYQIEFPDIDID